MNTNANIVFGAFEIFRVGAGTAAVVRLTAGVPAVVRIPVVGGVAEDVKHARHGAVVRAVAPLLGDEVAHVVSLGGAPGLHIVHQGALFKSNILEYGLYSYCYCSKNRFAILTSYRKGKTHCAPVLGPPVVTHDDVWGLCAG